MFYMDWKKKKLVTVSSQNSINQWSGNDPNVFYVFQEVRYPSGPHRPTGAHLQIQPRFPYLSNDPPWSTLARYRAAKLVEYTTMRPVSKWPISNLILPVLKKSTKSVLRKICAGRIPRRSRWLWPWFCPFGPLSSLALIYTRKWVYYYNADDFWKG